VNYWASCGACTKNIFLRIFNQILLKPRFGAFCFVVEVGIENQKKQEKLIN